MKLPFDKVYVISYVKNVEKRKNIDDILRNKLNITDYEYIYGIDTNKYKNILNFDNIPFIYNHLEHGNTLEYNIGHVSCTLAHCTAIQDALSNGYNKILVLEDDIYLLHDGEYFENILNNLPDDADVCRFGICARIRKELKDNGDDSIWLKNEYSNGTQCYSLHNQTIMKSILDDVENKFMEIDDYSMYNKFNVYILKDLLCIDANNINIY